MCLQKAHVLGVKNGKDRQIAERVRNEKNTCHPGCADFNKHIL